jgi:hypothetical protein
VAAKTVTADARIRKVRMNGSLGLDDPVALFLQSSGQLNNDALWTKRSDIRRIVNILIIGKRFSDSDISGLPRYFGVVAAATMSELALGLLKRCSAAVDERPGQTRSQATIAAVSKVDIG